jgi:hypothetical protein
MGLGLFGVAVSVIDIFGTAVSAITTFTIKNGINSNSIYYIEYTTQGGSW